MSEKTPPLALVTFLLTWIALVVGEICGELPPHSVICTFFECGGDKVENNFVRDGSMPS